jgi:hypothetical protein
MTPDLPDEDEDELMDRDPDETPSPSDTIAGPQTPRSLVAQRIAQVRNSGGQPDEQEEDDSPDPNRVAAMQFAKKEALTSGIGRALNSLAAGTGAKVDNSAYDQMDRQPGIASQAVSDDMDRSAAVQKAIEDRKAKQLENSTNRDFKQRLLAQKDADLAARTREAAEKKGDDKSNKAFTDAQNAMEQMRGNPAVQQAERDLYSSDKINSLIKQGGGNPDNLNPQFVKLLVSEVGKVAQGGSPTVEELKGLTPATLHGALADVWQKFSAEPTPAHAGAFIKQYKQYADTVSGDAQKLITDRYSRVLNPRKRLLRPDDVKSLEETYVNRFKPSGAAAPESAPQDGGVIPSAMASPRGPKVGTIDNGYIYTGGDPSDPHSWAKAK